MGGYYIILGGFDSCVSFLHSFSLFTMDALSIPLLMLFNFFEWRSKIIVKLRGKGLSHITMGIETELDDEPKKSKWLNCSDEALGLLCMSISLDFLFHIELSETPTSTWKILDRMFGQQDDMRAHELENKLLRLNPSDFENLQAFFSKFVHTRLLLKECQVEKKDSQLILSILSKLGPKYSAFVSTFYATKVSLGKDWNMPSFDCFSSQLIREQDKLI